MSQRIMAARELVFFYFGSESPSEKQDATPQKVQSFKEF